MDNVTHSLIGLVTGESIARATPGSGSALPPAQRRAVIIGLAIVANNVPDLDLLYSSTGRLRYLLEHRGYTHTIVGCALLAGLLYAAVAAWLVRRKVHLTRADHVTFAVVALGGAALHLAMDALNSYGVHPFWPLQNRWVYGDSIFIVEPLYWAAAAPLIFGLRTRTARLLLGLVLAAGVTVCLVSGLVAAPIPILFAALVLVLLSIGWRIGPRAASICSVVLCVVVTLMFVTAGHIAAAQVEAVVRADFPDDRPLDHILSPLPVNPLCWDALVLAVHDGQYVAHHAAIALAPRLVSAQACGHGLLDRPTFVPRTILPISASGIEWREFTMPKAQLVELAAEYCDAAALLRFARAPFAVPAPDGWTMGDLRFDRGRSATLSGISVGTKPDEGNCAWTPPWIPPREDLLTR